jgi:hypothetical protein
MKNRKVTKCIICKKPVKQERKTSADRLTCKRKRVNGVLVKSECEMEKNRRYQKKYRKKNPPGSVSKKSIQDRSVALSSTKHLAKHKTVKYKRHCLKCEKKFTGVGAYNRICNECTVINSRTKPLVGG